MTKPIKATEHGLEPHYKVRVVLPGAIVHLASWDQPQNDQLDDEMWSADWIDDSEYGDTIGFIDWSEVRAVTWRWSE